MSEEKEGLKEKGESEGNECDSHHGCKGIVVT